MGSYQFRGWCCRRSSRVPWVLRRGCLSPDPSSAPSSVLQGSPCRTVHHPLPSSVDMGAFTSHPRPDGSASFILRRSQQGGDEVQSSAALPDGGGGGLSWGCGLGWLRCCRSPGTRWI